MGLGIALQYILDIGIDAIWERVQMLARLLREQLGELPGATVQDKGRLLCGIVSFTLVGASSGALACQLHVCQCSACVSATNCQVLCQKLVARCLELCEKLVHVSSRLDFTSSSCVEAICLLVSDPELERGRLQGARV